MGRKSKKGADAVEERGLEKDGELGIKRWRKRRTVSR